MTASTIAATYQRFAASDGVELAYTLWSREPLSERRSLVLVLHGIGFHSEPYSVIAENLDIPGALFAGLDYRGHGRSGGVRGALPSPERIVCDIEEWIRHLESSYPASQKILIGESMSGPYAVLYAARNPGKLSGLALVAPAVLLGRRQIFHLDTLKALVSLARSPSSSSVDLDGWRLTAASDSSGFVGGRRGDPLSINSVSVRYILRIAQAIASVFLRKSLTVSAPTLILHGGKDRILSPLGSRLLNSRIKAPEKRLVILPRAYHTLLWDKSSSAEVFALIEDWILRLSNGL